MAGLRSGGFDGNPATWEITEGRCLQADGMVTDFSGYGPLESDIAGRFEPGLGSWNTLGLGLELRHFWDVIWRTLVTIWLLFFVELQVLSLEVAEHIPRQFETSFLQNLDRQIDECWIFFDSCSVFHQARMLGHGPVLGESGRASTQPLRCVSRSARPEKVT